AEQILLELREIPGTGQRRAIYKKWRLRFLVAMLMRVKVEHEVDERPLEACAGAEEHRESGAGHPSRALEVQDAQRGTELPVGFRFEIKGRRCPPPADLDVVGGRLPHRDAVVRQIRQHEQCGVATLLDRRQLPFELANPRGPGLVLRKNRARIEALLLGFGHRFARGILIALQGLDERNQTPAFRLDNRQLRQIGGRIQTPRTQATFNVLGTFSYERRINHARSPSSLRLRKPACRSSWIPWCWTNQTQPSTRTSTHSTRTTPVCRFLNRCSS